ncbi:glycoside hydrolase family 3 protein [Paenibacillus radicis (ex Xue et al. 2023)]|uniref:beta-N-acetylhexosaminidase n=1 Tax=Paenibacillus radicis (ex Xue et al. 2023) TaxID=2972489 RepID=A0ABT1YBM5_9BACL|nr:glycoside hydrolase family 3 N-terminal domain-containing protein [Paenibacillus radicis (ex Xue et al. 2023)]MCR8630596.1 glycoside hydrolase family 3 protein [Paenibacillus radicis (ex Xue et al. 2023)]
MVNLKAKPFYLSDEDIQWVETTIESMTIEEKIGQLFINLGYRHDPEYLQEILDKYHIGGVRYNPNNADTIYEQNKYLQHNSKIPLLIAANTESGGNGACTDGTLIGTHVQIGATQDPKYAYQLGYVSGVEGAAIGCNWSFAPIVDINYNWRNPVTMTRCFSDKPDVVLDMSKAYFNGITQSGFAAAMKHFPGDGVDERDHHLLASVNTKSCEEWDQTYSKVYQGMIEAGIQSVMIGHIKLPAYSRRLNPNLTDAEIMPATLSPEIVTGLLREQLGFNGLVLTDASAMLGLTSAMKRSDQLPHAIAAGCDMFLFFNDPEEDFQFMMDGYKNGIITEQRLLEALTRILGLKASLGLPGKKQAGTLIPPKSALSVVGCEEHKAMAREVADQSITLVKQTRADLPLKPDTHRRIMVYVLGDELVFGQKQTGIKDMIVEELQKVGFDVTLYVSPSEQLAKSQLEKADDKKAPVAVQRLKREKISAFMDAYDAVILFANVQDFATQNYARIKWSSPMSSEIPWYVTSMPTVFVSLHNPFHLYDVPMVKTYINAYAPTRTIIQETISKIIGESSFKGNSEVDAFCGVWDTRI